MAQLSALLSTTDPDFRAQITKYLRSSGLSIGLVDERHAAGAAPDVAIVDIRSGSHPGLEIIERLRASFGSASIFAVAATAEPDQILQAMRAGANEYLAWSQATNGQSFADPFHTALRRAAEKARPAKDSRTAVTLSFFGSKGGAGTTTLAVNSAIEIARLSKRPTLIVDFHQFLGEVSLFLGVRPRFTLIDAIDNLHRMDKEFLRELVVTHKSGLDILAGGDQVDRPGANDTAALEQLLQILGRYYDYIVIDVGYGTSPTSDVAVFASEAIFLVANPDIASIRNAHRMVDRFEQLGASKERLKILLNRMGDVHQIGPKQIESTLGHPLHMTFGSDYNVVSAAMNSGVPLTLTNNSELATQFSRFTRQIVNPREATTDESGRQRAPFLGLF